MDVLVTRYIGIYGTAILADCFEEGLLSRYPKWLVDEAKDFVKGINAFRTEELPEMKIAREMCAVYSEEYMEFGISEALFSMSKKLRCGLDIYIKKIPIKQETVEVCEFCGINPYALYSGYSAVIVCENGEEMKEALEKSGIPASVVGKTTQSNDKYLINEDEKSFLQHIRKDELKKALGRKEYYERTDFGDFGKEQ